MNFIKEYFPIDIAESSKGGPRFISSISSTINGRDFVSNISQLPKVYYKINSGHLSEDEVQNLVNFFRKSQGMMSCFLFCDKTDYRIKLEIAQKVIGTVNEFQIVKRYNYGNTEIIRKIKLPKELTLQVFLNDVILTKTDYSLMPNGIVLIKTTLIDTDIVKITCEFDIKMRFGSNALDITMNADSSYNISNLELIEVLN